MRAQARPAGPNSAPIRPNNSHAAALGLLDEGAELLVGSTCLKVAEQWPDVRPTDAAEDAVQNACERLFAFDDVPTNRNLDSGPVFGEMPRAGPFGAFSLRPSCRFRIIGRAAVPSTPRSGARPGQGI
jgi:hypothetical protein